MTEHQTIVSDISSISTRIEAIEQKLAGPQILPAEVLQQITEAAYVKRHVNHIPKMGQVKPTKSYYEVIFMNLMS
jgi:hypothetical protein